MYAVVRVRGSINLKKGMKDTLEMMKLVHVNHCTLLGENPEMVGMVKKVKDFVTWGKINDKTLEKLIEKKARMEGNRKPDEKEIKSIIGDIKKSGKLKGVKGLKPVFRMDPPRKGYEGIKTPYPKGALGDRGDKINDLLERMM